MPVVMMFYRTNKTFESHKIKDVAKLTMWILFNPACITNRPGKMSIQMEC